MFARSLGGQAPLPAGEALPGWDYLPHSPNPSVQPAHVPCPHAASYLPEEQPSAAEKSGAPGTWSVGGGGPRCSGWLEYRGAWGSLASGRGARAAAPGRPRLPQPITLITLSHHTGLTPSNDRTGARAPRPRLRPSPSLSSSPGTHHPGGANARRRGMPGLEQCSRGSQAPRGRSPSGPSLTRPQSPGCRSLPPTLPRVKGD